MNRQDYVIHATFNAKRGIDLPQTKLGEDEVRYIRSAVERRIELRNEINETLSNAALAEKYGVHQRTIEKIISYETGRHIL